MTTQRLPTAFRFTDPIVTRFQLGLKALLLFCAFSLFGTQTSAQSENERILSYDVEIDVQKNRSILVTEKIKVYAAGRQIKRGITRNLPKRRDVKGTSQPLRYADFEIFRDGEKESFMKRDEADLVLYLGREDYFLPKGIYEYEIRYRVPNQVIQFDGYDEIYWNAIGTDVKFPVEQATATVFLPKGAESIQQSAYTGAYGSQGKAFSVSESSDGSTLKYTIQGRLKPYEGLSVAVGFTPGVVKAPTFLERFGSLLVLLATGLWMIWDFISTWFKYGRDPQKPESYPMFSAPEELSPASVSFILKESYRSQSLTASIIALATKGYMTIEVDKKPSILGMSTDTYILDKTSDVDEGLSEEEKVLHRALFGDRDRVVLDGKYKSYVAGAKGAHRNEVVAEHSEFVREGNNIKYVILPFFLTIAAIVVSIMLHRHFAVADTDIFKALLIFVPVAIVSLLIYRWLIVQPTKEKLKLQSEIEGFRLYLEMAEKDRMNLLNPPSMTPQHFEELLPYAYALGVENNWAQTFKSVLDKAGYAPNWSKGGRIYYMPGFHRGFNSSVNRTATQPSSDGGGGFSGGGGGGGGVGGW